MELSQFTDYSLRTLIYVGLKGEQLCSIQDIASAFQISRNHLVKVVNQLGKLGWVATQRGRGGGIRLGVDPTQLKMGDVVRKTENLALVECHPPRENHCCIIGICRLQSVLHSAAQAFLMELDRYTLQDLLASDKALRRALNIQA